VTLPIQYYAGDIEGERQVARATIRKIGNLRWPLPTALVIVCAVVNSTDEMPACRAFAAS